jgi:hypothetical protein
VVEDVSGFLQQMESLPDSTEELQERIFQDYNIRVPRQRLEDILALADVRGAR